MLWPDAQMLAAKVQAHEHKFQGMIFTAAAGSDGQVLVPSLPDFFFGRHAGIFGVDNTQFLLQNLTVQAYGMQSLYIARLGE